MDGEKVTIEKLLNNGFGLARNKEGRVMFVPDALPGEVFLVVKTVKRKGVIWADQTERLEQSPIREETFPCGHFPSCGGCRMLHVRSESEMDLKISFLKDVLSRIGKINDPQILPETFAMINSRIRGKFHVGQDGTLGFKGPRAENIISIEQCSVIPEAVTAMLPQLKAFVKEVHFIGDLYFATEATGQKPVWEFRGSLPQGLHPKKAFAQFNYDGGFLYKDSTGRERFRKGYPMVRHQWNGLRAQLSPSSFFQSNPASWPFFLRQVKAFVEEHKLKNVWDVHAGVGFLSSGVQCRGLYCSEPDKTAFSELKRLFGHNKRYSLHLGSAESLLGNDIFPLKKMDGAILDPPRAGLSDKLRNWLKEDGPPWLLYFSCDMASFSRDLADLNPSYQLHSPILAMNLNPGTLRLETGCVLKKMV